METANKPEEAKQIEQEETNDGLVDHYWNIINYINSLIRASEIKAGLILSFYGILLNFFFQYIDGFVEMAKTDWTLVIFMVVWFSLTITSIYFSFKCFMPLILAKYDKNIFFFGDVIGSFGSIKEYSSTLLKTSKNQDLLFGQLGEQVFINSQIASTKFKYVNKSIRILAINIALIFIFSIIYATKAYI
jgi:hypothetical protein